MNTDNHSSSSSSDIDYIKLVFDPNFDEDGNVSEESMDNNDSPSSSPDIDYEALSNFEEIENTTENLIESTKNYAKKEVQEKDEELPLENPICILLDQRNGQKRPVGITELQKAMKEANFEWNYSRLPLKSDPENEYEY